eukprot:jgi/Astpho2/6204/Aster-03611
MEQVEAWAQEALQGGHQAAAEVAMEAGVVAGAVAAEGATEGAAEVEEAGAKHKCAMAHAAASSTAGGGGGYGGREEANPFEAADKSRAEADNLFSNDNTGIDFDAYDDIPVEATGNDVPAAINTFADVDLGEALAVNVQRCGYTKPTPVQKYSIPIGLAHRDLMACAQTGSGKTAAFCFPIIANILRSNQGPAPRSRKAFPQALVLSPTRELSCQIYDEARKFMWQTGLRAVVVYGGAPVVVQLRDMERGCDMLVATPGRLSDLIERGKVSLEQVHFLALDEADRMLDMGFEPQIRRIVDGENMPRSADRQTLLFSATFPKEIQRLAADFMTNYIFLAVGRVGSSTDLIVQHIEFINMHDKRQVLLDLVGTVEGLTLVFVETKRGADALEDYLVRNNFPATSIHGDRSQQEREMALRNFRTGRTPILVATDVAARGLDIPHVTHVINFDLPTDIDDYVHRIGRTGRAGKKGLATAFFTDKDAGLAKGLAELLSALGLRGSAASEGSLAQQETNQEVPGWLQGIASRAPQYGGKNRRGGGNRFGGRDFRRDAGAGGCKFVAWTVLAVDMAMAAAVADTMALVAMADMVGTAATAAAAATMVAATAMAMAATVVQEVDTAVEVAAGAVAADVSTIDCFSHAFAALPRPSAQHLCMLCTPTLPCSALDGRNQDAWDG